MFSSNGVSLSLQLPKGREVDDNDSFSFHDQFAAPLYRIKVRMDV